MKRNLVAKNMFKFYTNKVENQHKYKKKRNDELTQTDEQELKDELKELLNPRRRDNDQG